jgi:NAD(P)-dependent dehydrogenase (short-subunit alcohol dehydrogenase family)
MSGRLAGQVAVITGAASGIGRATAALFLAEGAKVLLADINAEGGAALAQAHPGAALFRRTDVTEEAQIAAMIGQAREAFGRIDCLFNNAGFSGKMAGIETLDLADFDRVIAVLLRAVLAGFKHVTPVMKAQGGGVILSTASIAGLQGGIGPYAYSAAKAGVIQVTRSAALELAPFNIRVNCLCPGAIATPIFGSAAGLSAQNAERLVPRLEKSFKAAQPLPRAGLAEDVAQAALYLAAESGRFVSGHALVIDGALTAGHVIEDGTGSAFGKAVARVFDPAYRSKDA